MLRKVYDDRTRTLRLPEEDVKQHEADFLNRCRAADVQSLTAEQAESLRAERAELLENYRFKTATRWQFRKDEVSKPGQLSPGQQLVQAAGIPFDTKKGTPDNPGQPTYWPLMLSCVLRSRR